MSKIKISNQGKIIKFVIKRYDINCNFIDDFMKVRYSIYEQSNISRASCT